MDTLDLQNESELQTKESFLRSKFFQTFILILLIATVSSVVTWYILSFQKQTSMVTNNGEVVNSNYSDNLPATQTENTNSDIQLDRIKNGSTVSSPLVLRGTVKQGWMFEGQFTVQIVGADGKIIVQAPLGDLYDGGWVESDPVAFEGKVEFVTDQKTGTLVFKKANPSGLPENDKSYTIFVNFAKKDFQALLKDICKYQGENIYPNYVYEISDLPIKSKNTGGGFCRQGSEELENAYLSLYLFSRDTRVDILLYDEVSMEGGHGGPPFLGFYGTEVYNNKKIRIGAFLVSGLGGMQVDDINAITLRGERAITPAGFETIYINTTRSVYIDNAEVVNQIASEYLEGGSEYVDLTQYTTFETELVNSLFGDSSKISPEYQKVIDEMISDLNSFEVK